MLVERGNFCQSGFIYFVYGNLLQVYIYLYKDKSLVRFYSLVLLFVLRIILLVFSADLVSLILGWDGLGLSSYLLVVFYQNPSSIGAGIITALRNRIGDAVLILRVSLLLARGRSSSLVPLVDLPLGSILVLIRITKSAQLPFSA